MAVFYEYELGATRGKVLVAHASSALWPIHSLSSGQGHRGYELERGARAAESICLLLIIPLYMYSYAARCTIHGDSYSLQQLLSTCIDPTNRRSNRTVPESPNCVQEKRKLPASKPNKEKQLGKEMSPSNGSLLLDHIEHDSLVIHVGNPCLAPH